MAASVYSDWITYASGSATRLSRLRLYIKDLSDQRNALVQASTASHYAIHGRDVDVGAQIDNLSREIENLQKEEKQLAETVGLGDGTFQGWTSGRARL